MNWPQSVSLLDLYLFGTIMAVGACALLVTVILSSRGRSVAERRSRRSSWGIALQALGFVAASFGPVDASADWLAASSLIAAALIGTFGLAAVALFIAAAAAMGSNWSVVARTRSDHQLIRSGPFAVVRHPIYLALLLYLLSLALAFGHWINLGAALPVFIVGTAVRIREEEKLLRAQFGEDHTRYAREVRAFIPKIF